MLIISAISECSCLRFLVTLWVAAGSIVMVAEMVWLVLVHLQGDLSATRADLLPRKGDLSATRGDLSATRGDLFWPVANCVVTRVGM